jgi:multimeric flavodoxin WrbA
MAITALAINGSPRTNGNTAVLIEAILAPMRDAGIRTQTISLAGTVLSGCTACGECQSTEDRRCGIVDDPVNDIIQKMIAADAIIIGSPVYTAGITSGTKALLERVGYVSRWNGDFLKRKVGIGVVAAARAGALPALDQLHHFFFVRQFIIPGSAYWALGYGRQPGDVLGDTAALENMAILGRNAAWLLQKLHGDRAQEAAAQGAFAGDGAIASVHPLTAPRTQEQRP